MSKLVAITVTAPSDLDVAMDPHFGRAPAFLIVDADTGEVVRAVDNAAAAADHGAGTSAAAAMSQQGVSAVISGHFGPKALQALGALGVGLYLAPDGLTAREALERFGRGELEQQRVQVLR